MERYFWHHANLGFSAAIGRHTLYGWLHLRCPTKSVEGNQLTNAREAISGWRKLHGDDSRDPLPEEIYLAAVRRLTSLRRPLSAAAVFCQAQLYLRPSELLALRPEDVLLPVRGARRYRSIGVVIAPRELEATTKARSQDDTILVDSQCHEALGPVLAELVRIRALEEQLFPLTLNSYEKVLRDAGSAMGLTTEFVPHTLRHCGPANDLFFERRSMAAVAKRGRWSNIKSVQRYGKSGRLIKVWRQVSERDRARWTAEAPMTGAALLATLRRLPAGYRDLGLGLGPAR
jgi:integrase